MATRTIGLQSQGKEWVILGTNQNIYNRGDVTAGLHQTKLWFNEAMPPSAQNRATRVGPPAPIVIEKLIPRSEDRENVLSPRSSISFSAVSEERLVAAVRLAKRDLRQRRHESLKNSLVKTQQGVSNHDTSNIDPVQQNTATITMKSKSSSTKEKATQHGSKLLILHTPQKHSISHNVGVGQSPPTRDLGPGQSVRRPQVQLSQEIRKLQIELGLCIQTTEKLTNRDKIIEDHLEPEEQRKIEVRRQKQEARSLRVIYVLQQQVKDVQEHIEKLRTQNKWDTKKSTIMDRLAAAHRGTVRAMKTFTQQLSEPSDGKVPSHYMELGQLIRQLSLCTAKVEGSALPETALDILQKLEVLDSALSKQESSQQRQARARSSSPPPRKPPQRSMSTPGPPRGPTTSGPRGPHKAVGPKKILCGRRMISQNPRSSYAAPPDHKQLLRAGLKRLDQQRELTENPPKFWVPQNAGKKAGAQQPERSKMCDAGFRQPTVSSRLRENQLPPKDPSVPWIPVSPHSPPRPQRSPPMRRAEPRCLFSPLKPSQCPPSPMLSRGVEAECLLTSDKMKQAQNEALRHAWLDKLTAQRLRALNQLSKEEVERLQRLRSEVGSPTLWAERAEQQARQRIQPLLEEAQQIGKSRRRDGSSIMHRLSEQAAQRAAGSAEQLGQQALPGDLVDDSSEAAWAAETDGRWESPAQCLLRAPTLESMLKRMEEMQRDQEEVRMRFATITYSDPLSWDRVEATVPQGHAVSSSPASPQPIRLTRPVLKHIPAADIFLGTPVETGVVSDNSLTEDGSQPEQPPRGTTVFPVERSRGSLISVPGGMLRSIRQYREAYDAYLRLVAHDAVGSFNPWAVADSLADELLSEALADVAAEFQDVCEEYADAVFTSEFLQPTQSPPAFPVFPLGTQ